MVRLQHKADELKCYNYHKRPKYGLILDHFALKFYAIAEKTAKSVRR